MTDWQTLTEELAREGYVATPDLAMALHLSVALGRPLLLEGAAGVGKTEVAKALAAARGANLIRLQCYEGLDANHAIYEWNYQRQLLSIRAAAEDGVTGKAVEERLFSEEFLLKRPLLEAISQESPPVLLIDEIDRADEEFEAFLLEILSDFQVSVPELGTFNAAMKPVVILTSNRTRELNDALKRRCLYLWIDYPSAEKEREIIARRVPGISSELASSIATVMRGLRAVDFYKRPGVAETLDWARALLGLSLGEILPDTVRDTAGVVLKYRDDIDRLDKLDLEALIEGRVVEQD